MSYECAHCKIGTMPLVVRHISRARSSHHHFTCYVRRGNYIEALERERDKLRAALEKIRDEKHRPGCGDDPPHVAPGGHECSCPQTWAKEALLGEEAM